MPVIKVSYDEESYKKLAELAEQEGVSVQDYIRSKTLDESFSFSLKEAVEKALEKYEEGACFTLPELYGTEWKIKQGTAAVFGRRFNAFVEKYYPDDIECVGKLDKRHTAYRILKKSLLMKKELAFTSEEAAQIALERFKPGERFTLPMIYGERWGEKTVLAGRFGIDFADHIKKNYQGKIEPEQKAPCAGEDRAEYRIV